MNFRNLSGLTDRRIGTNNGYDPAGWVEGLIISVELTSIYTKNEIPMRHFSHHPPMTTWVLTIFILLH